MTDSLRTPLNQWHRDHHGRMVDFAGWDMPVQYSSIVEEHSAVRSRVGLFDISHMGRLEFTGAGAGDFLNRVLTNDTTKLAVDDIRYSLVCRPDGGILDDVLVYRLPDRWCLVVNASNRTKIVDWLRAQAGFEATGFADLTLSTGMIAVQGPRAVALVAGLCGESVTGLRYYTGRRMTFAGVDGFVSRTGYTGEDGCELIVAAEEAERIWNLVMERGESEGIVPAGLGCRDTLRLEAAMPLYGHELLEDIDPLTAGLSFAVKLNKSDFIGRDALAAIRAAGISRTRVGLVLEGRRIAREHAGILEGDQMIGEVTSGTFSPTLQQTIAMGYVQTPLAKVGTVLSVDLRGTRVPAQVVALPFYRRSGS